MKVQDILFIVVFLAIALAKGKGAWRAGMISAILAALLFVGSNLFTAQRFTWYSFAFFSLYILINAVGLLYKNDNK